MNVHLYSKITPDKICIWTFNSPGQKANVLSENFLKEIDRELTHLENNSEVKGLVIQTDKPKIFLAGADLKVLAHADPAEIPVFIEEGQQLFNRLEALNIPKVSLIHGACLGGGMELVLATDWRIASNDKSTKLGFPEVNLGLLPAWGGCTRLPKLLGFPKASSAILTGKMYNVRQAKKVGLIDEIAHEENHHEAAEKYLAKGKRKSRIHLSNFPPIPQFISYRICKGLKKRTHGNFPAPLAAQHVLARSTVLSPEASLKQEEIKFAKLAQTNTHKSLLRLHFLREKARRNPGYEVSEPVRDIGNVLVLGGGIMGSGIAHWLSSRGMRVILKDVFPETLAKGMASIRKLYSKAVRNKIMTPLEAQQGLDRITPVSGEVAVGTMDLVIEAIVEDLPLKQKVLAELEAQAGQDTLLATNTSALPIEEIGKDLKDPSRLLGLHFFNPVLKMPLLEVIETRHTRKENIARAFALAHRIGKIPVLAKDSPGFLVNRILIPYLMEALQLFQSGETVKRIDALMLQFGMPMGPLRLMDEIGLDTALHVSDFLAAKLPAHAPLPDILEKMVNAGFLGKKNGQGFYQYSKGSKAPAPNPKLLRELDWKLVRGRPWQTLLDRMVFSMVNEAARCLDEGVSRSSDDIDLAMVLGAGWCPHLGGPLYYAETMGFDKVTATMRDLAQHDRPYFMPSQNLVQGLIPQSSPLPRRKPTPVDHITNSP